MLIKNESVVSATRERIMLTSVPASGSLRRTAPKLTGSSGVLPAVAGVEGAIGHSGATTYVV